MYSEKRGAGMKNKLSFDYDESRVLYKNDFEEGLNGWTARGPEEGHFDYKKYEVRVELCGEEAHSGSKCMKISGRTRAWNGAYLNITKLIKDNIKNYEAMVWVKLRNDAEPSRIHLSLETTVKMAGVDFPEQCWWEDYNPELNMLSKFRLPTSTATTEAAGWDVQYPQGYATEDGWVLLRGKINIHKSHFDSIYAFIETSGPQGESEYGGANINDIYIDDFILLTGE